VRLMVTRGISMPDAKVLIMGITFKENCPDVRNTKVVDLVHEFASYGSDVDVYDPWADAAVVNEEYGIELQTEMPADGQYDAIVMAVSHEQFKAMSAEQLHALGKDIHVVYDIKYVLPIDDVNGRL